jgi:hypothetical protein
MKPRPVPILRDHLLDPSGGLVYQLRAARHRHGLWAPFHAAVADWLADWQAVRNELVIVGPNAGHALPAGFLASFETVVALEPDPLARWLLARRPDARRLRFDTLDCLVSANGLTELAGRYPQAAILFSNVLGQINAPAERWTRLLARHLSGHVWASFHDVISTRSAPDQREGCTVTVTESLEATLARFWKGREITVFDHETFRLNDSGPFRYAPWQITGKRWHLVEWAENRAQVQA